MKYNFEAIRKHYAERTPAILEAYAMRKDRWTSPYSKHVDFMPMFSRIESDMWQALRCYGHAPLYPQYPAGGYFLDFGHPGPRIAIECDGRQWHLDKRKDARRDAQLEKLGWTVFRITGSDCARIVNLDLLQHPLDIYSRENLELITEYYEHTPEGLVEALGIFYFEQTAFRHPEEIDLAYGCLLNRVTTGAKFIHSEYRRAKQRHYDVQEDWD